MDDFVILLPTKSVCIYLKKEISEYLKEKLHLELNSKSRYYPNKMGVNFCGYRIYETHILLRNISKKKIKGKIREWNNLYIMDKLNISKMKLSLGSWLGHAKHANTYNMIKNYQNRLIYYQK